MTANGEVLPWDRLIVCTGWNYTLPDVPGNDLEGLPTSRTSAAGWSSTRP